MKANNKLIFISLAIMALLVPTAVGKGGRGGGGGRSGGRSSGRSSSSGSGWSFFGGKSKSRSSDNGIKVGHSGSSSSSHIAGKSYGSPLSETQRSGGWFSGFFHSSPYHYTYRPTYISGSSHSSNTETQNSYNNVEQKYRSNDTSYNVVGQNMLNTDVSSTPDKQGNPTDADTRDFALGYVVSKSLSSDFFSIFNMVHDIGKYPEQIKNKEFPLSTTTTTTTTTTTMPTTTTKTLYAVDDPYKFNNHNLNTDEDDMLAADLGIINSRLSEISSLFDNMKTITTTENPEPIDPFSYLKAIKKMDFPMLQLPQMN